jgi:hypothetical protein
VSVGRIVPGSRVRLPESFLSATPLGAMISQDGTAVVVSVTMLSPDIGWAMVSLGLFGEFGFRPDHLARHGEDFSLSVRWWPIGSDQRIRWTTSVHPTWRDARRAGMQMAHTDGVGALNIFDPWGDRIASWAIGGEWEQQPRLMDQCDAKALRALATEHETPSFDA